MVTVTVESHNKDAAEAILALLADASIKVGVRATFNPLSGDRSKSRRWALENLVEGKDEVHFASRVVNE